MMPIYPGIVDLMAREDLGAIPFSNGSEASSWVSSNCHTCVRCIMHRNPKAHEWQHEQIWEQVEAGRHCAAEVAVAMGFITGHVYDEACLWIGATEIREQTKPKGRFVDLPSQCLHWSNDDFQDPDKYPLPPDNPNQLIISFDPVFLFFFKEGTVNTSKAVIESEDYV